MLISKYVTVNIAKRMPKRSKGRESMTNWHNIFAEDSKKAPVFCLFHSLICDIDSVKYTFVLKNPNKIWFFAH